MRILALDIANKTGYAHNCTDQGLIAGTVELGTKAEIRQWGQKRLTRRCDDRVCRLLNLIARYKPDTICFEDVQFVHTQVQGQLWASLRTAIWAWKCSNNSVLVECVPVQTLKLYATGKGGAGKALMCRALAMRDGRFSLEPRACVHPGKPRTKDNEFVFDNEADMWLDDNATDAIWLFKWAQEHLCSNKNEKN